MNYLVSVMYGHPPPPHAIPYLFLTNNILIFSSAAENAAEILLRIYQNPIHLNGARWWTRFWTHREVRRRKKTRNAAAKLHA